LNILLIFVLYFFKTIILKRALFKIIYWKWKRKIFDFL